MTNSVLKVENLNKSYGDNQVLYDINFDLNEGELVSIIGPSGAGKSTLLRCINRLTEPESTSTIIFDEENIVGLSKSQLTEKRKQIGMIFQHYNLVYRLSALENVLHGRLGSYSTFRGALSLYKEEDIKRATEILEVLGLGDRKYYKCKDLSGGQKQRVGIGRALIQDPKMILCDEPIASLDPQSSKMIMEHLRWISQELRIPCLVNLHQVDVAKAYSDRIIGIKSGKIVFKGKPEDLSEADLENIYGAKIDEILA
ncbi:MAG: phosphonate ABC transporter ATP-binding protein [Bacillota bacterium]|nr:phosphonate ABC transporter ATP-binding protein [Bacillota bacterium]